MQSRESGEARTQESADLEQNYAGTESGRDFVDGYESGSRPARKRTDNVVGSILSYRLRILSDDDPP
jgi:hypothetical protein